MREGREPHHPNVHADGDEFAALRPVAALMAGFAAPWYVAGGWALDLHLGRATRPHHDIDIAILRADQLALQRHFAGWDLRKVIPGAYGRLDPWAPDEWLELPIHEIHARFPAKTATHVEKSARSAIPLAPSSPERPWLAPSPATVPAQAPSANAARIAAEMAMEVACLELLLNESAGDTWIFRRNPAVGRPLALAGRRTPSGLPYLAPEIVLLYKAPQFKPDDDADFRIVAPALGPERRAWLREALEVYRPGHPWVTSLATTE